MSCMQVFVAVGFRPITLNGEEAHISRLCWQLPARSIVIAGHVPCRAGLL